MALGYSLRLVQLNGAAAKSLGVELGRACIKHNMPVAVVAQRLGVSRQTVYSWFTGASAPRSSTEEKIKTLMDTLSRLPHGKL
jgi:DNA-binding transcriptional regulator YiaG